MIEQGDSLGIVGESGSGKSTLAMAVLRLLHPATAEVTGIIRFMGKDLLEMNNEKMRELRWNELAVVFQKSLKFIEPGPPHWRADRRYLPSPQAKCIKKRNLRACEPVV